MLRKWKLFGQSQQSRGPTQRYCETVCAGPLDQCTLGEGLTIYGLSEMVQFLFHSWAYSAAASSSSSPSSSVSVLI